jgi:DNA-3-methyladenine glycosylase II
MTAPEYWPEACTHLGKRCKVMKALIKQHPAARVRSRGNAFQTLARSIVGQQISVKAAQSVWDRVAIAAGVIAPPNFLALSDDELRACGLSRGKVTYLKDLARHFDEKLVNPRRWPHMTDDEIVEDLTRIKGIGRWSAEMFLIFYLWRPNIFPVADIGVIRAIEKQFHERARLSKDEIEAYRSRWAPWNTVATWYLWRSLEAEPVNY